jgi:iron complex outermembrane receptor protein
MRRTMTSALVGLVAVICVGPERVVHAQVLAMASNERAPRFFLATGSKVVPLDVSHTTVLARRVQLQLEGATLKEALTAITGRSGLKLAYSDDIVPLENRVHLRAEAITTAAALTDVLFDTGLDVVFKPDGSAVLVRRPPAVAVQQGTVTGLVTDAKTQMPLGGATVVIEGTRHSATTTRDGNYRIADVVPGTHTVQARYIGYAPAAVSVTVSEDQEEVANFALQPAPTTLGELVVTAQKRQERYQDVPVPVTAISGDNLVDKNQLRLQDFYTSVPGLSVTPQASTSSQYLTIRGLTTGVVATNPTVGITVDDVPYGPSTGAGGGGAVPVPDIDPGDLARVEVLRGPQGTLYGASSLGGLLKFVTVDPSTDHISGRMQVGSSSASNGPDLGYSLRGSVNLPLSDRLAVRANGFTRQEPGYIDNVQIGQQGVNKADVSGGRLAALWKASDVVSLKLSGLYQDAKADAFSEVNVLPGLNDLQQSYLRGTGASDRKVQAYSAVVTAKLGKSDLTAVSGYNVNKFFDTNDLTYILGPFSQTQFGVTGSPSHEQNKTDKFTQEFRLSAPLGPRLEWLIGAFYTHESSQYTQNIFATDSSTGATVGQWATASTPATYEEYAAFGDVTFNFTDRFDVQVGGRESHIRQTFSSSAFGPLETLFVGQDTIIIPEVDAKANALTYLLTPRFRVSSDFMVYARLASGYRPGGTNAAPGVPRQYDPDKSRNYEIGAKAELLDHKLSLDASLYHIDWKDIQLQLVDPVTFQSFITNESRAKSQGVELSVESRPLRGLTLAAWATWDNAVLTQTLPAGSAAQAASGDRLPYSSRFSGNFSLEQDLPLARSVTGFVGGAVSYVGDRQGEFASSFASSAERQDLPSYTKVDLRVGAKYDAWTLNFFINNITDKRALLSGGLGTFPPFAFIESQPRTASLSLGRTF